MTLAETIRNIRPVDQACMDRTQGRLDRLTKPRGSLGRLEELAVRYVGITGEEQPKVPSAVVLTFAADHGVTEEGVSAYDLAEYAEALCNLGRYDEARQLAREAQGYKPDDPEVKQALDRITKLK